MEGLKEGEDGDLDERNRKNNLSRRHVSCEK
jgi:hypothetical protein